MVELRILLLIVVTAPAVLTSQVTGAPDGFEQSRSHHALGWQYAVANTVKMRFYASALLVSHPVKFNNRAILAGLADLGVDASAIENLRSEMLSQGDSITLHMLTSMTAANGVVELAVSTNTHVLHEDLNMLEAALPLMADQSQVLDQTHAEGGETVQAAILSIAQQVEALLMGHTGTLVEEIRILVEDSRTLLTVEQDKIDLAMLEVDRVAAETLEAVGEFIAFLRPHALISGESVV